MLEEDVEMLIKFNSVMSEAAKNVTLREKKNMGHLIILGVVMHQENWRVGEYKEAENKNEGSKRPDQTSYSWTLKKI